MKNKNLIIIGGIIVLIVIGGIILVNYYKENGKEKLIITKEYDIKGLNSLAYDGEYLWGLAGDSSYSEVEYKKRIVQIDKNNGEIKSECSIDFIGVGMTFIENSLLIIDEKNYYGPENPIYKINPQVCIEKKECNKENGCIIDSFNVTSHKPKGLTSDGEYLYIINDYTKISKYSLSGEFIKDINNIKGTDIVWDGQYFWTIESVFMASIPEVTPPPSHYDIRAYDKNWTEVFHQEFEIETPVWYGITYDGENLWISDGYHDQIRKLNRYNI
jgi:hypothetical protein